MIPKHVLQPHVIDCCDQAISVILESHAHA